MADDTPFRLALLFILAGFLPFAVYRRLRSRTREKLDRRQEGLFILVGLRLSSIPVFLSLLAWLINPEWMAWSSLPLPAWLRWVGVAVAACGAALVVWTFHNLGANLTDTVVTRKAHTLVTTGPYRFVRHPFYVAFALGVLGNGLAMANWFFPLAGLVPLGFLVARTRIEEQKLIERFGTEYQDYMCRVGRFVPRFKAGRFMSG
jgi:protein-S-isoprenylcysteine O-methyltransferase Ste14